MYYNQFVLGSKRGNFMLVNSSDCRNTGNILINEGYSEIRVFKHKPNVNGKAIIFNNYNMQGKSSVLWSGSYNVDRIEEESEFRDGDMRSIYVYANTVAILYDGENFEKNKQMAIISGPCRVNNFKVIGLDGKVSSVEIFGVEDSANTPGTLCVPITFESHTNATRQLGEYQHSKEDLGNSKLMFIWLIILFAVLLTAFIHHEHITKFIFADELDKL